MFIFLILNMLDGMIQLNYSQTLLMQPDYNIPIKYLDIFDQYLKDFIFKENYNSDRLMFMLKLIRIKWSLIIMNPILNRTELYTNDFSNLFKMKINKSLIILKIVL